MKAVRADAQALNLTYRPLTPKEEQRLLRQAKGRNKKRAAAARLKLFESLLPWALSCSNRWAKTLTVDERASAAAVVIGQAIEKYDPSYGTRLSTIIPKPMRWILLRQQELQQRMTTGAGDYVFDRAIGREKEAIAAAIHQENVQQVKRLLRCLDKRSRLVIELRYLENCTLKEVGARLGITRERVRQIQKVAVERMGEVGSNGNGCRG